MKKGPTKYIENNWAIFWKDKDGHLIKQGKRISTRSSWEHQIAARIYVLKGLAQAVWFIRNELKLPLREALEICKVWKGEDRR
jgi:hypothetical protein